MTTIQDPYPEEMCPSPETCPFADYPGQPHPISAHPSPEGYEPTEMTPFDRASQEILDSLEPGNVNGYAVAQGHAFDGITLHGPFDAHIDALDWAETNADTWQIVPLWNTNQPI